MAIPRGDAKAMVHHNQAAIAGMQRSLDDHAICRGPHALAIFGGNINTGMKRTLTTEGVEAFAEVSGNAADHRPKRGTKSHLTQGKGGHQAQTIIGQSY